MREEWLVLSDNALLAECRLIPYKASGPGGQKRNKVASAVRLVHVPSDIAVTASGSRSQSSNKATAVSKLRRQIALQYREDRQQVPDAKQVKYLLENRNRWKSERFHKEPQYWLGVSILLDGFCFLRCSLRETAQWLGISTGGLGTLLKSNSALRMRVNYYRRQASLSEIS